MHHNKAAARKLSTSKTVCFVLMQDMTCGVFYKGEYYPDDYLEPYVGKGVPVVEFEGFLHIFSPGERFITAYKIHRH